MSGEI